MQAINKFKRVKVLASLSPTELYVHIHIQISNSFSIFNEIQFVNKRLQYQKFSFFDTCYSLERPKNIFWQALHYPADKIYTKSIEWTTLIRWITLSNLRTTGPRYIKIKPLHSSKCSVTKFLWKMDFSHIYTKEFQS